MANLRHRYQRPETPEEESLPLDTICTILTRQSTRAQKGRNVFSAEVDPKTLVDEARRLGFLAERIQVLDWDMGKGAYNTTIEERPALHHWLTELLPSGKSRVVLVSQEDRLFRDRTEIQVNRFIEQVAQHRGWVVCGSRVYNMRREMDKEQFRLVCKFGKLYIEFHLKQRLHPARERAALQGRYVGGMVSWGYRVDYNVQSPTYKHLLRYEPHAVLVADAIFGRFARMERPTPAELARSWWREGLVWPFFGPEVDPRQVHWHDSKCHRDEDRGGYQFVPRQAQTILTNPIYLGWMPRKGEVARDLVSGEPRTCHEPLVDPDLFWWCYDRILPVRPSYAPALVRPPVAPYHPRRSFHQPPGYVAFIGQGSVRCAQHGKRLSPFVQRDQRRGSYERTYVRCWLSNVEQRQLIETNGNECTVVPGPVIEDALCKSFIEHLWLDDQDVEAVTQALARLAERRQRGEPEAVRQFERQIGEQQELLLRAKRLAYAAPDLAGEVVEDIRRAKRAIAELEARLVGARADVSLSAHARQTAEQALAVGERIRATFLDWSREGKTRVIGVALETAVLGRVDRRRLGLWMRWQGGCETREALVLERGQTLPWVAAEDAALAAHYHRLTHEALLAMLPSRTLDGIWHRARQLKLSRPRGGPFSAEAPMVVAGPETRNEMVSYGFTAASGTSSPRASSDSVLFASCSAAPPPRTSPGSASRHPPPRPSCAPCRSS